LKIMNTSNKPFEFTWDGSPFGPIKPGEIVDYPDPVANHAVKRSAVLFQEGDQSGDIDYFQMEYLHNVDKKKIVETALYECPLKASGQCDEKAFNTMAELKAHMDTHWELLPEANLPKGKQVALPVNK